MEQQLFTLKRIIILQSDAAPSREADDVMQPLPRYYSAIVLFAFYYIHS